MSKKWPVEWQQMTALLAYADYWATGEADLAAAYMPLLVHNLRLQDRDGTGVPALSSRRSFCPRRGRCTREVGCD